MKNIETFLNEALIHKDSKIQAPVNYKPRQGEHDKSKLYDELWDSLKDDLWKWDAGPVYGWCSDKGIAFTANKGKNVKKDDWIVIVYDKFNDDFTVMLSKYGTGEEDEASKIEYHVYIGELSKIIDDIVGLK